VKLLFIGDIVGQPGRRAVKILVPDLRQRLGLDWVIANGENSAGGSGITPKVAEELFESGIDILTSGDHLWDQKEVIDLLHNERRFVRPLNYPPGTPGQGSVIIRREVCVIFVDVHAEATSEKIAMGRMLDGQVSAVVGTHTHVQTADEQIFPGGTAYLTDAGFTGPHESVLGREIEPVIRRFLTNTPQRPNALKWRASGCS
jgi:calcineurin-like phosphoesterase